MSPLLTKDFRSIVLNNRPLLDVRAEVEFNKGAFPNTVNIPILTDEERHLVGIEYKKRGNESAIKLAEELIKQEGKALRVQKWKEFLQKTPKALLYCFRGGQRSGIAQAWLEENGINITRLEGGYKAFRNFLMDESLEITSQVKTLILGGRTGSGKTLLLNKIENSIDLEGLANHRGSSFGNFTTPQPSQINFENSLGFELIQFKEKNFEYLVLEHESHNIGRAFIPKPLYTNMMDGQLILLETPIDERTEISYHEYVTVALQKYQEHYRDDGVNKWAEDVNINLDKIKKRLGSEFYLELKTLFDNALKEHLETQSTLAYKEFVKKLLQNYYDPMYDYQIEKSPIPLVFKGNAEEVLDFITNISKV